MSFTIGDRVRVVGTVMSGKTGTIFCFDYRASRDKPYDYGVRLGRPLVEYGDDATATGFDEDELEFVEEE